MLEDLRMQPLKDVPNQEFEHDFEKMHDTDEEIDDLYDSKAAVVKKIKEDKYFYMDDKKWNELVKDGIKHGAVKETKQCEEILEEMLNWDKLLPGIVLLLALHIWLVYELSDELTLVHYIYSGYWCVFFFFLITQRRIY